MNGFIRSYGQAKPPANETNNAKSFKVSRPGNTVQRKYLPPNSHARYAPSGTLPEPKRTVLDKAILVTFECTQCEWIFQDES
ncbi:hypothetical protein E6O75_ATG11601 [Venturia nashicola]|uniref:Uncharacterized protein n=1 Tax=Venturia nashicola TaxID=86259 RepID=A0A4Z1P436_9PEZI|nr:hypothetical protein E6O75_ATG11601 [Venturia nashicola]